MPEIFNLGGNPESEEDLIKSKQESRRSAIKKIATGVAGATAIFGVGTAVLKKGVETQTPEQIAKQKERREKEQDDAEELPPREIIEDPKEYKSGESIETPAGPIEIIGWKIAISEITRTFLEFRSLDSDKNYVIKFRSLGNEQTRTIFSSEESKELNFPTDAHKIEDGFQEKTAFYLLPDLRNPMVEVEVLEYAGNQGELIPNIFAKDEEERRKIGRAHRRQAQKAYRYKIRLLGTKNPGADPKAIPRVFAEGKLSENSLASVAEVHRLIGKFRETAPIYVFGEGDNDPFWKVAEPREEYGPVYNRITLFTREFLHPDVPKQAEQIACHEACHSLTRNSKTEGLELEATRELRATFSKLAKEIGPEIQDQRDSEVFSIFREFSYYPKKVDKEVVIPAGHPWGNMDELFASAITVFRYYPNEFIVRFNKLPQNLRGVVTEAVNKTLGLLRSMNQDPETLKNLIPNISVIEKAVGNSK